jgi:hypothetical protein
MRRRGGRVDPVEPIVALTPWLHRETLAALGATTLEDEASSTCGHALAKPVFSFALEIARLECAFHDGIPVNVMIKILLPWEGERPDAMVAKTARLQYL